MDAASRYHTSKMIPDVLSDASCAAFWIHHPLHTYTQRVYCSGPFLLQKTSNHDSTTIPGGAVPSCLVHHSGRLSVIQTSKLPTGTTVP